MADLHPFRGDLTLQQIADGMNCATENAARLARDARLLFDNERWPTAASVAALSIEESGKIVILRRFLTADSGEIKGLWKEYRSHTKKNLNWVMPDLVARGARRLEDFRPMVDGKSDHPELLDSIKQLGLYTDCLGQSHWSVPADVIDKELAGKLVAAAEVLSPERAISVRELELWVKHMKPVWNKHSDWMKTVLANWYAEMQSEGLMPSGPNKMKAFVKAGLSPRDADQLKG